MPGWCAHSDCLSIGEFTFYQMMEVSISQCAFNNITFSGYRKRKELFHIVIDGEKTKHFVSKDIRWNGLLFISYQGI
ncbi:6968_t:CDS:2 [Paraglomus brasilianum]|uniref:6968_t:CDS:1 n=1 Tax=Paraglomus brasilianum TaxID=144538 RepID=A0A9N9C3B6_9GLOM|nr:6968_t:CDS:2 [Paraglomus brasilianum]